MENCNICQAKANQKCAGCNTVFYCTREHQKIDWKRGHKTNCKCYDVVTNEILGRYLVAKRDIKPGEIIIREGPCVAGPKITSVCICLGCHSTLTPPSSSDYYKCSKCNWPLCGKSCENSIFHIDECNLMSEKNFKCLIVNSGMSKIEACYCVIVPLRLILLKQKNPSLYKSAIEMVSHLDQRMNTKLYNVLRHNLVPFIKDILKIDYVTEREILHIAGIMDTNCFDIILQSKQIRARGLYLQTSLMAHDCMPNTKHFVDGNLEMKVFACGLIKKGEIIFTSYTHPLRTTLERRMHLKVAKCFDCMCKRCSDPTELSTFASSIKCFNCNDGILVSENPLNNLSDLKCIECGQKMNANQFIVKTSKIRKELETLDKKSADDCEKFLKLNDKILPSKSIFIVDVKFALCTLYGNIFGYTFEDLTDDQLARKQKLCEEMATVLNMFEPGISNSVMNARFELSATKIVQLKRKFMSRVLQKSDAEKLIAMEMKIIQDSFKILIDGCESKTLLECRLKRVMEQSVLR